MKVTLALVASLLSTVLAAPAPVASHEGLEERATTITATIPAGQVIGIVTSQKTENFAGIPYAYAPTGSRRLKPPVRYTDTLVNFDATQAAPACPQMAANAASNDFLSSVLTTLINTPLVADDVLKISEDCLTIDVSRPAGTKAGDNLPVLFWIFGGGFELGWSAMYDGASLVSNAVTNGKPFVFVAVNYRVGGFGFMPGKEILADGSANLGHLDQRMGLQWVADNIAAFGGDPTKVTIWGESAGAISVYNQMSMYDGDNTYNGKALFRGAIMNSGSVIPADPVDCPKGQAVYDAVVAAGGCSGSSDTLNCLRALPYDTFLKAANSQPAILSYNSVALTYIPRPDGTALTQSAELLLAQKKYAAVPMIIGDQEDEGTLFSLFQSNTTSTTAKLVDYLSKIFFHDATTAQITSLVNTYPSSLLDGSPFNTGLFNEIYPGFKRLAAILGDATFTITRRIFLEGATTLNPSVPAWSYLASYDYGTPILGTFHGSDILQVFFGILPNYASKGIQSYYVNFVYNLNPNDYSGGTGTGTKVKETWPQWDATNKKLIRFYASYFTFITDTFRQASEAVLKANISSFRI